MLQAALDEASQRGDRDGAPAALPRQRARRRTEGAALALRSQDRELRGGRRLPAGGRDGVHPLERASPPHPRARRSAAANERPAPLAARAPAKALGGTIRRADRGDRRALHDLAAGRPPALSARHRGQRRARARRSSVPGSSRAAKDSASCAASRASSASSRRGRFRFRASDEDIHMAIERRLTAIVGPLGGKLHTGRSRNDQVATRPPALAARRVRRARRRARAAPGARSGAWPRRHATVIMPGYTHLQRAQPVLLAHHLLAYREMLARDRGALPRLPRARRRAAARRRCARRRGLRDRPRATSRACSASRRPTANSLDAVERSRRRRRVPRRPRRIAAVHLVAIRRGARALVERGVRLRRACPTPSRPAAR